MTVMMTVVVVAAVGDAGAAAAFVVDVDKIVTESKSNQLILRQC